MKLEDIKNAVVHAAEAELKRAYYNAVAVIPEDDIAAIIRMLHKEVYESNDSASE